MENPELPKQLYLILKIINGNGCIHRDVYRVIFRKEKKLRNLGRGYKPNTFKWNDLNYEKLK